MEAKNHTFLSALPKTQKVELKMAHQMLLP